MTRLEFLTGFVSRVFSFFPRRILLKPTAILLAIFIICTAQSILLRPAMAASGAVIYDDELAVDWNNWSWDTNPVFANESPVHSGSFSIAVTYFAAWGGLQLHTNSAGLAMPVGDYTAIRFWVNGNDTGGQSVSFRVNENLEMYSFTVPASTWQMVTVPLTAVGNPTSLSALIWQDASGGPQLTYFLDDISLVKLQPDINLYLPLLSK